MLGARETGIAAEVTVETRDKLTSVNGIVGSYRRRFEVFRTVRWRLLTHTPKFPCLFSQTQVRLLRQTRRQGNMYISTSE